MLSAEKGASMLKEASRTALLKLPSKKLNQQVTIGQHGSRLKSTELHIFSFYSRTEFVCAVSRVAVTRVQYCFCSKKHKIQPLFT